MIDTGYIHIYKESTYIRIYTPCHVLPPYLPTPIEEEDTCMS